MSLADELLADLDEIVHNGEENVEDAGIDDVTDVQDTTLTNKNQSVHNIAKLRYSKNLEELLQQIELYSKKRQKVTPGTSVESDPEYNLIVASNNMAAEVDNEIHLIHKFVRDIYNVRFPELESLVHQPMDYTKTVMELGNNIESSKSSGKLQQILPPATIMVVSITASRTQGEILPKEELDRTMEACNLAIELEAIKSQIYSYVESRMCFVAPNLTAIVGASTAAKLMGSAGGLKNLSTIPGCNILLIGAQKKSLGGFSTIAIMPHTGFIYYSELVQNAPPDFRRKVADMTANKCALAVRVDCSHEYPDGSHGQSLRSDILQKLEKLQEPAPVKQVRALPVPIDVARKKRGGKRVRKMKERLGMTDMRKAANRMTFGEIEEDAYQEDLGLTLGTLGKSKMGRIRGPVIDSKTKVRISKSLQQKIRKQQAWGGTTTVKKQIAGTASSIAFTPLQGLEIVNPQAAMAKETSGPKYFSSSLTFGKVEKK